MLADALHEVLAHGITKPSFCCPCDLLCQLHHEVSPLTSFADRSMPARLSLLNPFSVQVSDPYHTESAKELWTDRNFYYLQKALSLTTTNLHDWLEEQVDERCTKSCISRWEVIWALMTYHDFSSAPFFKDKSSLGRGINTSSLFYSTFQLGCSGTSKQSLRKGGGSLKIHPLHGTSSFND